MWQNFSSVSGIGEIEFEGLNFCLGNIDKIIRAVISVEPALEGLYARMRRDRLYYEAVWNRIKGEIRQGAPGTKIKTDIYIHAKVIIFKTTIRKPKDCL